MVAGNAINESTTGICGFTGTAFTGTAATQHAVIVGGSTSSTLTNVGPTATSGQVLQSAGSSADPAFSTATYPATATGTGKILRADGTNWVATTATYPDTAGTSGNVLTSDGTNWTSAAAPTFNPSTTVSFFDDFLATNGSVIGNTGWTNTNWSTAFPSDNSHPGVIGNQVLGATNTTLYAFLRNSSSNGNIILGGGAITLTFLVNIANLSSSGTRYTFRIGLGDTISTSDQANGVYFEYSDNLNSGQWVYKTASASTRTANNSTVAVTTGWRKLAISINAAASSISFTVDGVSLGTAITTNIPTTTIAPFFYLLFPSVNAVANTIGIDYFTYSQTLTTPR